MIYLFKRFCQCITVPPTKKEIEDKETESPVSLKSSESSTEIFWEIKTSELGIPGLVYI